MNDNEDLVIKALQTIQPEFKGAFIAFMGENDLEFSYYTSAGDEEEEQIILHILLGLVSKKARDELFALGTEEEEEA